jgi:site-specific DNA recombinase
MDRPGIKRLMADIEAGRVDCVVVYKVDRLSRSLLDFARMMETFERHQVSFVSVTQQFNTATSMGRLVLNVLLSFAQFEREMISERTRDKIAATRRKGKWAGGIPILGYNVVDTKLVVEPHEAERVRQIFELYLEQQSLLSVVKELNDRGWRTKRWKTRKGTVRGGRRFDKTTLYQLLTNVALIGKVSYKDEVHAGEHKPIVDAGVFDRVQTLLARNGRSGGRAVRNKYGALLRGRLRCAACDCAMSHSYSTRQNRRYRYYVCTNAQKRGWHTCPSPSIPAAEVEQFVVDQIKGVGRNPRLIQETLSQTKRQVESQIERFNAEREGLWEQLRSDHCELGALATAPAGDPRVADVQDRIREAERRVTHVDDELAKLAGDLVDEADVEAALAEFDAVWDCLAPRERNRIIELLIEQVVYDGNSETISMTFRPTGIRAIAAEQTEDAA